MYKKILKTILNNSGLTGLYKNDENAVFSQKPHFLFSAENPMYPENHVYNLKHHEVIQLLKGKGYKVEEVNGHYGKPERSILVHNPPKHSIPHLLDLSKKLGQESSIYSDGYNHEMHFHGGENAGLHIKGQGTTYHKRKPDDHFTEMANGKSFTHIFNFDEAHENNSSMTKPQDLSTKKSEVDFVKSEPNHPLIGAHAGTKLIHFSTQSGLKDIDPNFQGQRIKDSSSKYGKPEHPVSFFYLEGAKPEALVTNGSTSKYVARLGHHKVYDLGTDPENIKKDLREKSMNRQINPGSFTRDELDAAIKAKGYGGIYNSQHEIEDMRKVVGMYHKMPVEKEVAYHPRDAEVVTDAAHEVHHSLNKSTRRFFVDEQELQDIEKAGTVSASKHIGLGRLKQIQQDNNLGANGKDYDAGELKDAINERSNSQAQKMVRQAGKQEKEMAAQAAAGTDRPSKQGAPTSTALKEQEVIVKPNHNSQIHAIHKDTGENPKKWTWNKIYSTEKPKVKPAATLQPNSPTVGEEKSVYAGLKKREILMMKGAMNKLAPYNPDKHITAEDHKATENWTSEGDDQDARSNVPEMHANAKVRALHKMTGMTEVRKHPKTGERMYLLHRGMGEGEYMANHKGGKSQYAPGTLTSWTPKYSVAKDFAGDHLEGKKPRIVSAWIPESHIHNVPNQTMIPDENTQFRNEHEVIVNHQGVHPHAHPDLVAVAKNPRLLLDNKINMKGQAEQARRQDEQDPRIAARAFNRQIDRAKRAEEYKRNKFGKREVISMKTLAKGDISSKIRNGVAGLAVAAATMNPMNSVTDKQTDVPAITQQQPAPVNKRKERILSSIMDVESSGGRNTKHKAMPANHALHQGERAYGSYGLMPLIIRETLKKHPELGKVHAKALNLTGDKMHEYMNKNPGLEKQIAEAHYDKLARHFGDDPVKIGYAWLGGVTGTWRAIKENRPLKEHWHVKKILKAYGDKKDSGK